MLYSLAQSGHIAGRITGQGRKVRAARLPGRVAWMKDRAFSESSPHLKERSEMKQTSTGFTAGDQEQILATHAGDELPEHCGRTGRRNDGFHPAKRDAQVQSSFQNGHYRQTGQRRLRMRSEKGWKGAALGVGAHSTEFPFPRHRIAYGQFVTRTFLIEQAAPGSHNN